MLAKALGVNQVVVVVNKLDAADPPWSKERYESVKAEVGPFLGRTGFRPKKVPVIYARLSCWVPTDCSASPPPPTPSHTQCARSIRVRE